ncbi:hypothetical protein [Sphingomonas sp.]|jgi:hypothetical protein|uniref:hypothetical protein n=1 Tax=Sphingomonas sp. TaxID=28214 RepID=UPI0035672EBB
MTPITDEQAREALVRLLTASDYYDDKAEDCMRLRAYIDQREKGEAVAWDGHASDCAKHNEPAYPAGECDCGAQKPVAYMLDGSVFSAKEIGWRSKDGAALIPLYLAAPPAAPAPIDEEAERVRFEDTFGFSPTPDSKRFDGWLAAIKAERGVK